ncbi:hypothetical protein EDB81DRAFT_934062 [Dactylonectria macrodidyma]|uniref:Protein CAP22 n=1 Tax=Dactylonectria macrodidyma TaxID=307937 RepID=A0A9P9ESG7_9HYPO|nr:hypothetical protein EDB81DRAFT_934062 [Dactylonectria macrodidyma]
MYLIVYLAALTVVIPAFMAEELRADDVPSACSTICQPIVDLTNICDIDPNEEDSDNDKRRKLRLREYDESDEEAIEANCICSNTSFDVAAVMALCASCMAQNSQHSEDVDKIMSQCSFSSTSYLPAATTIVTDIEVQATKSATTGISASTSTGSASSSTESAGSDAGKMAVSIAAAVGAVLVLMIQV